MKKMLLILFSGTAFFTYAASAQSKNDTPATYKEALRKQNEALQKQREAAAVQQLLAKKQSGKAKEQEKMMDALKQEMLKDGLIQSRKEYELIINSREMLVNGKKQAELVHNKYIKLINSKRNKPFGEKEEWTIKYP